MESSRASSASEGLYEETMPVFDFRRTRVGKLKTTDQVRIGDVIYLTNSYKLTTAKQSFCLAAYGLITTEAKAMQKQDFMRNARLCLFKIESVFTLKSGSQSLLAKAKRAEEAQSIGQELHYGDWIQLRHVFSSKLLSLTNLHDHKDVGRYKVLLQETEDKSCWIQVMPNELIRDEGHQVKYNDNVLLAFRSDFLNFYMSLQQTDSPENWLVDPIQVMVPWKMQRYQSCDENPKSIKFGGFVSLLHKASGQYLAVAAEAGNQMWLDRLQRHWSGELSHACRQMLEE
jgi:hypothetical protein